MKNLILCCLALLTIGTLAACSDDSAQTSSTTSSSTAMQTDSKDMKK